MNFSDSGAIDYDEFEKFVVENDILKKLPDELCYEMMEAFNTFDKNGDGLIDRDELKVVLTQVGECINASKLGNRETTPSPITKQNEN